MTAAEYLADQLFSLGVRYVFGIPGSPSIPYMEAFRAAGIEFILVSNESAAGIMADVSARLTSVPGVCHATFGPGATNMATGTGEAFLDRSPVIVLTSEMDDPMLSRTVQMNIDHQKLFGPITKATFRVTPSNIGEVLARAFELCREEYPGPVHLGLPSDLAFAEVSAEAGHHTSRQPEGPNVNDKALIRSVLGRSRSPVIAAGLTAARLDTGPALLAFLDKHRVPVVLTPMAKGLLPESHPCYAGVLFHALSDFLEDIFEKTDLVIGLGYDPVEYNYESWIPRVPLVHFNSVETDMPVNCESVQYTGKPAEWFSLLDEMNHDFSGSGAEVKKIRDEMKSVFDGFTGHFGPVTALRVLQEEMPVNSIITADVGSHLHLIGQYWRTEGKRNLLMTNGWSGMGFGIPASLAVQLLNPESVVACVTGDGGFLMMAGEVITARRYNLPVIIIVFSDGELNLIRVKQSWQNIQPYGTGLYSGDLFNSDNFLGVRVLTATDEKEMRTAVNTAISLNEPVIINARIDPEDYEWLIVRKQS
ncbi:MAG: thiamine pyrophosphate-binding protein [Bacteroidales bacterium]